RFRLTAATAATAASQAQIVTSEAGTLKAKADLARAEADADVAAAAVKRLEALNSYRYVRAPFDGIVVSRHVDRGAFVRPAAGSNDGSPLFEMTRIDRIRVVAFVSPGQVARIAVGQSARFHTIGGLPGKRVSGTVARSAMALEESSRKMRIEMHIQNPPKATPNKVFLAPGLFGTLTVESRRWEKDNKLALVPTAAIGTDDGGRRFVVVVSKGESRRIDVEIIFDDAKQVGIVGEVHPGDMVRIGGLSEY
ncbi:MAG: efflux RND transporter periplasmic adaptor subunit, partial [Planctomycetaceae bacterium]